MLNYNMMSCSQRHGAVGANCPARDGQPGASLGNNTGRDSGLALAAASQQWSVGVSLQGHQWERAALAFPITATWP